MKLSELIALYRSDADDGVAPYLANDADLTIWLNEAVEEAAVRARLIFEDSDNSICVIPVTAGRKAYYLDELVCFVTKAWFTPTGSTETVELTLTDRFEQDRVHPGRRGLTQPPTELIVDDTTVTLGCIPEAAGSLRIDVYRLPNCPMKELTDAPEIAPVHHRHLVPWATHRAYSRPDSELQDLERAKVEIKRFETMFGLRPDAMQRRDFHANTPMHNKAYW